MAWPPPIPPNTRANTTPQLDAHADDHNLIADALAEIVAEVDDPDRLVAKLVARNTQIVVGLNNDQAARLVPQTSSGFVLGAALIHANTSSAGNGLFAFRVLQGNFAALIAANNFDVTGSPLAGSSGAAGKATFASASDGLYLENRTGGTRSYRVTVFSTVSFLVELV